MQVEIGWGLIKVTVTSLYSLNAGKQVKKGRVFFITQIV
jgi:hypothetical protein